MLDGIYWYQFHFFIHHAIILKKKFYPSLCTFLQLPIFGQLKGYRGSLCSTELKVDFKFELLCNIYLLCNYIKECIWLHGNTQVVVRVYRLHVVSRLWYKGYDLSLDYGIYYSFHVVYGNNLNTLICWLNLGGRDVICQANCYRLLVAMLANKLSLC